jgi:hypothetical protein
MQHRVSSTRISGRQAVQVLRIHVGDVVMFLRLAEAFRGTGKALQKNFDDGQTPALPVVLAISRSVSHAHSVLNSLNVQPINVSHCHLVFVKHDYFPFPN